MRTRTVLLLASLAAATFAVTDGVSLRWAPKEGDTLRYQTTGEFDVAGKHATITAVNVQKVIRVDADGGYLVQATPTEGKTIYEGTEYPVSKITTLTSYGATGEVKEIRSDQSDAMGYRMANLTGFHAPTKPVAIGDAWSSEGKADPKTGAVAWKADYKVQGEDTIGPFAAIKVEVTAKETEGTSPGKAVGIVWIGKDGVLARSELTWSDLSVPGAPGNVSGKITMTRLE